MKKPYVKRAGLAAILCLSLSLSACYIPPDDIPDQSQHLTSAAGTMIPFQTIAIATQTPMPTIAPVLDDDPEDVSDDELVDEILAVRTVAVIRDTPMPTATPSPEPTDILDEEPEPTSSTLRRGASGEAVKEVQQQLKELGYYRGAVDGNFGEGTETAVKAFQRASGLSVDGAVGPTTYNAMFSSAAVAYASPTPNATKTPAPSETLRRGDSGARVKAVQQRLKELGYYRGSVDGEFGEGTEDAVRAFQKRNGLSADGAVGKATMEKLNSDSAKTAPPASSPTPAPTKAPKPTPTMKAENTYIEEGATGTTVQKLQDRLIYLGWLGGFSDGNYGAATQTAVMAFQKKTKGLDADGVAGPATIRALMASNAAKSSNPVASVGETLALGSESGSVRALQQRLKTLGYYRGTVDGKFGEGTETALKEFQERNEIKPDGRAGTTTLNTLYGIDAIAK